MKQLFIGTLFTIAFHLAPAQKTTTLQRPKLVVGIVVDQMRWDYLFRFYNVYKTNGGFKTLLGQGFSCNNTMYPYLPTVTAAGHACIYTGSVPAINGIVNNVWWDNVRNQHVYCVSDSSVSTVGSNNVGVGKMSPKNLWATTITDELRLATNFNSKVIGISMKDRGAILPAGHAANAAYWYDGSSGNFVTSTYYRNDLPIWLQNFNDQHLVNSLYKKNWDLFLPTDVYQQYCDSHYTSYTGNPFKPDTVIPYPLAQYAEKDFSKIMATPLANNLLVALAQAAIDGEHLGGNTTTDFLTLSFSSPDYVSHIWGPNSWEALDTYARLDASLAELLHYLDKTIGQGQYLLFLTADHAGAHVPAFLEKHHISTAGYLSDSEIKKTLNAYLFNEYHVDNLVLSVDEYNISLNHDAIDSLKLNEYLLKKNISRELEKNASILTVVDFSAINAVAIPEILKLRIGNSYTPTRVGDLLVIQKSGVIDAEAGGTMGTMHSVWNPYDSHVPLLWYGWHIPKGNLYREIYTTDIASTLAALLHIQMPSGSVGKPIVELIKN